MILKLIDAMEQKLEKLISISSGVLPHVARKALSRRQYQSIRHPTFIGACSKQYVATSLL